VTGELKNVSQALGGLKFDTLSPGFGSIIVRSDYITVELISNNGTSLYTYTVYPPSGSSSDDGLDSYLFAALIVLVVFVFLAIIWGSYCLIYKRRGLSSNLAPSALASQDANASKQAETANTANPKFVQASQFL